MLCTEGKRKTGAASQNRRRARRFHKSGRFATTSRFPHPQPDVGRCLVNECLLSEKQKKRFADETGTWLVDDAVLDEVENDLQRIIICTKTGDSVVFNVTKTIKPSSRSIISWPLTVNGFAGNEEQSKSVINHSRRTTISCPGQNEGVFTIR